jgi:hypothetical protein
MDNEDALKDINIDDVVIEMKDAVSGVVKEAGRNPKLDTSYKEDEVVPEVIEEKEDPTYNDDEKKAIEMGWTPKDKFKGDAEKYVDAKEFVNRTPLYEKIKNQNEKIKKLEDATNLILDINRRQHEMLHSDKVAYYEHQRRAAIEINSPDDVDAFDKLIEKEKEEIKRYQPKESVTDKDHEERTVPRPAPETMAFIERNKSWFNEDNEDNASMSFYAASLDTKLMHSNPGMTLTQRLAEVEKNVKKVFSHKFENPNRLRPSAVSSPAVENKTAKIKSNYKYSLSDVPSKERHALMTVAKQFKMPVEEYIQQLYETGYLKNE